MSDELKDLEETFKEMNIKEYTIIEKNGIKIAVIGLMGKKADNNVNDSEVQFDDMVTETKRIINHIKGYEEAEMILVLSQTGTSGKNGQTEDERLAKKVPE